MPPLCLQLRRHVSVRPPDNMDVLPLCWFYGCLLLSVTKCGHCWDSGELELFDLVEEINANFYDALGVEQTATSAEIRKAYRRLSVKLHPDKNKEEGAEERFRQIVAIYEVLKDEQQRTRYNDVLVNGLPDWRTPVYYYRKARKLGLVELAVLLFLIITIGQFIVGWSMYLERKYEMEEVFLSRKKKDKKGKKARAQQAEKDMDEALQEHLDTLPRPKLTDLVPCRLALGLVSLVTTRIQQLKASWAERDRPQEETSNEESEPEEMEERVKRPKRRQRVDIPEFDQLATEGAAVVYTTESLDHTEEKRQDRTGLEWTDDETSLLAKAVARFPSGMTKRWEKIAEMVGRSVSEVTSKSKSIRQNFIKTVDPATQGVTGAVTEKVTFKKGLTLTQDITVVAPANKAEKKPKAAPTGVFKSTTDSKAAKAKPANNTAPPAVKAPAISLNVAAVAASVVESGNVEDEHAQWTQTQQKTLEWALSHYPRGTADRWEKVSEHITGKTKEDCMLRFKYLADIIKRKKEEAAIAKEAKR